MPLFRQACGRVVNLRADCHFGANSQRRRRVGNSAEPLVAFQGSLIEAVDGGPNGQLCPFGLLLHSLHQHPPIRPSQPPIFRMPQASVAAGATVGVGRIMFDIANGATTGQFAVTFQDLTGTNSLSDPNGGALPFTTQDGSITITPATTTVPEPSQGGLVLCALAGFAILLQRRRT